MKLNKLNIIKYPDPRLRKKSDPVTEFNDDLVSLAARMLELMRTANGVGLAAPQLGIDRQLFVCNHSGKPEDDKILINPVLSELAGLVEGEEGCLSIPDVSVSVRRARSCRIKAQDVNGKFFELQAEDTLARIFQHETDHLNGKLILDYMSQASKISNRRAIKHLEETFRA